MNMLAQQKYQQNSINTATPGELTLMLFKGVVRFINATKKAMEQNKLEEANECNQRAQAIISELMITLKSEYSIANDLLPLYEYMQHQLIQANIKKDPLLLDEVKSYMEELSETWSQAMKLAKK